MFIAHVKHKITTSKLILEATEEHGGMYSKDVTIEDETYTTSQPSQAELISLLKQYQINLNKRDAPIVHTFQLLSVSDVGISTPLSTLRLLGVTELSRPMMADMKSSIVFKKD